MTLAAPLGQTMKLKREAIMKSLISLKEVADLEPRTLLEFWPQTQKCQPVKHGQRKIQCGLTET